jgi:hypothetical protein
MSVTVKPAFPQALADHPGPIRESKDPLLKIVGSARPSGVGHESMQTHAWMLAQITMAANPLSGGRVGSRLSTGFEKKYPRGGPSSLDRYQKDGEEGVGVNTLDETS